MRLRGLWVALVAAVMAGIAMAEAPYFSPRPKPRPPVRSQNGAGLDMALEAAVVSAALATSGYDSASANADFLDPVVAILESLTPAQPAMAMATISPLAVAHSVRPRARPTGFALYALPSASRASIQGGQGGAICGVAAIRGQAVAPVNGSGRCGIAAPVRVASVSGIPLSMQPTIDCPTAIALNTWVRDGVLPTIGRTGGGVAQINVIASYSCRTRNSQPGAKLSEHALGHALDVAGVTLHNGTKLTVEDQWDGRYAHEFRTLYRRACGPFGTVLSPDADRYHYNHFHLDTARYRGGPYCH